MFGWTTRRGSVVRGARRLPRGRRQLHRHRRHLRAPRARAGASEEIIGRWMAARGNRDELSSRPRSGSPSPAPRPRAPRRRRRAARTRCGASAPIASISTTRTRTTPTRRSRRRWGRSEADRRGQVRYAAALELRARAARAGARAGTPGRDSRATSRCRTHYNLMERDYERELAPVCAANGIDCVPYFGLATGFLTGKYRRAAPRSTARAPPACVESYLNDRGERVLAALDEVAGRARLQRRGGRARVARRAADGRRADRERADARAARGAARVHDARARRRRDRASLGRERRLTEPRRLGARARSASRAVAKLSVSPSGP